MVCSNPLLIDGYKFDFRVYVLVTAITRTHISAVLFHDGLARLCTTPYAAPTTENMSSVYMHLTNYDLNKTNADGFEVPDPTQDNPQAGSKRSLSTVLAQIAAKYNGGKKAPGGKKKKFVIKDFWKELESLVAKTLVSFWPVLIGGVQAKFPHSTGTCTYRV